MKKIFSSLTTALRTTPFLGRTLLVLSFFFLIVKQVFVFLAYGQLFQEATSGATFGHYLSYIVSDFAVFLVMLIFVGINMFTKKTIIKLINNIFLSGIFFLFVLDIFTMYFFQSRISILDMGQFVGSSIGSFTRMIICGIIILSIVGGIVFVFVQDRRFQNNKNIFFSLGVLFFAFASLGVGIYTPNGFSSLPQNILSINIMAIKDQIQGISPSNAPNSYEKFFGSKKGLNKQPNIIIVFAESLSAIDSLRVGGVHDNLPYFDTIQKQGITFQNFIANGGTSDTAHVSLLMGVESIKPVGTQIYSYSGYTSYTDSLPIFFKKQGYTTTFVSAARLDFLDQRDFLSGIGFDTIIGEEAFANEKEYTFDSAPDHVLYNKTLQTIHEQTGTYLVVLQTISYHKPYDTPYGKNESDALRYSDKSLFYFYLQLKKSDFFDNGILVIVGDHRKMNPLEDGEKEALGDYRYTKSLATIVGTGIIPGTVNTNVIQHTDFFYSLKHLVGKGFVTLSKLYNDTFTFKKSRDRGISYSRYYNNKYTVVSGGSGGKTFDTVSEIARDYPLVNKYLGSYIDFQYTLGVTNSGHTAITFIGHRGSPLATTENSLSGFLLAKKNGADGIELDVSYTKDKVNIVMHGESVYPTICGDDIKVRTHTLEWLQNNCPLTNGEKIMTLEEMLQNIDGLFQYYFVEIKVYDPKYAEQQTIDAIETVKKMGMQDRVIFTSYDKTATYVLGSYKNIIAGRDTFNMEALTTIPNMNHPYYLMPQELVTKNIPKQIEAMDKKLVVYTVNTTGDLQQLYTQGVRMVMTDNVPLLKTWAEKYLSQ